MIRTAAKNHDHVAVVTDPADYAAVLAEIEARGGVTDAELRRQLRRRCLCPHGLLRCGDLRAGSPGRSARSSRAPWRSPALGGRRLRYGENPHQNAAFYVAAGTSQAPVRGLATASSSRARSCATTTSTTRTRRSSWYPSFEGPAIAIIKHANPCGVAIGSSLLERLATWRCVATR